MDQPGDGGLPGVHGLHGYNGLKGRASKATALLLALGTGAGAEVIRELSPEDMQRFAAAAIDIDSVDIDNLDLLIDEFSDAMSRPSPLNGGAENARSLLKESLEEERYAKIWDDGQAKFDTVWPRFEMGSENKLVPYLLDEHPQTIAFILINLDADLSAKIVSLLPGDRRDQVARRLLKLLPVAEPVSELVQTALRADLLVETGEKLQVEGRTRVAQLLNRMERQHVDDIITNLKRVKPEEAAALKKMLFSFEDLPKLDHKHRLILFDKVQTEQVMMALRGISPELKETALSSLGARARRMIEAELATTPQEETAEVQAARQAVAQMALNLAATGEIIIPDADE